MKRLCALFAVVCSLLCPQVMAQTYPSKPIRLIVPFAAGGTTDLMARIIAEPLGKLLGQAVVVDNKAGGGGVIGAAELARATADGYTLGLATASSTSTNPAINPKVPYDPLKDFSPIINMAATPNVLAVNPAFPAKDFAGLLAEIRAKPGHYDYASSGTGPSALPHIKDKRLLAMAVAAPERLADLPGVPTFKELGLEPVNRPAFYGIYGPKAMPKELVQKLNAAVLKVLQDPAVIKRIEATGSKVIGNTPEQFAQQLKVEFEVYKKVVHAQKLHLD